MANDIIDYGLLTQNAMRGVAREALAIAAALKRTPGDHHFYIHFKTTAPGVEMSDNLRAEYPDVMPIVLQHQFWDLYVDDDKFSVTLSFNRTPEHLIVPFSAVVAFMDPSVKFGLRFDAQEDEAMDDAAPEPSQEAGPEQEAPPKTESAAEEAPKDAEVISLDQFRKT
ncbi:MAG: ClpXP protease specificity-enhancing factor SspB [Pseudomonadota bacterium]